MRIRFRASDFGLVAKIKISRCKIETGFLCRDDAITGVHSNQDQIWLVKIGECIGFYVYRRS